MKATIQDNIAMFKSHMNEINFKMEENITEKNTFFASNEKTAHGGNIRLIASFPFDHNSVDIYCFNLAEISNPSKREAALNHINDLNINYRYAKFTLSEEGSVAISLCIDFTDIQFAPELVMRQIMMIYHAANDEYEQLMKIAWS
ncbi:YbjN domain-containing protein [Paenibacillus pini]|uniref:YbjN domain-containing protein n=1 Tax=Paenibacillus pini JCM 16418 TaxID=1236976 RepID=W7YG91_9BACL|nr:YbjN domain-containing protein [Paenibacillus pini]GAF09945.1 hypothetical protein JCM16418_4109 [Paenibacillus pini JCM 16418]